MTTGPHLIEQLKALELEFLAQTNGDPDDPLYTAAEKLHHLIAAEPPPSLPSPSFTAEEVRWIEQALSRSLTKPFVERVLQTLRQATPQRSTSELEPRLTIDDVLPSVCIHTERGAPHRDICAVCLDRAVNQAAALAVRQELPCTYCPLHSFTGTEADAASCEECASLRKKHK